MLRNVSRLLLSQLFLSSIFSGVSQHYLLSKAFVLKSNTPCIYTTPKHDVRILGTALQESKIPKDLRDEIYRAEANTEAAKGRNGRVITYSLLALVFLLFGTANVAFSTIKQAGEVDLSAEGYGWVDYVPLLSSTWGGYMDIVAAGLFGTMVELENRTREEVAEKIWEELQRRKNLEEISTRKTSKRERASKKEKRLAAFAEVMLEPTTEKSSNTDMETEAHLASATEKTLLPVTDDQKTKGILEKLKDFYKQADQMAASQALILNKKLEDQGILEKITDDTGLKVIGKRKQPPAPHDQQGKPLSEQKPDSTT